MINYCIDYIYQDGDYEDLGTIIESTEQSRDKVIKSLSNDDLNSITDVYENENCYCYACYYGECACGNFKEDK